MYLHYEDAGEGFDYTEGAFNLYEISVIHDEVVKIEINRRHQGLMSSEFTIDCKG